jgi:hypothetical protein
MTFDLATEMYEILLLMNQRRRQRLATGKDPEQDVTTDEDSPAAPAAANAAAPAPAANAANAAAVTRGAALDDPSDAGSGTPSVAAELAVAAVSDPAAEAADTLATLKTAGDPAYLSSPDGAYAAVNDTAAATNHAIGRDRRKRDVRGALFTLNSSSGVSSFTRFDFAPIAEDSKKYLKEAFDVGDGNGAPKQAKGGPSATPAAETSVVKISLDSDLPANSAENKKADTPQQHISDLELYKTFVPLALVGAGQAEHPSGSFLSDFIASDIETMFPGVLRQTTSLNESSTEADISLGGDSGESTNADDRLYSFCEHLHTTMMEVWKSTNTCLTHEQLNNLARGVCVHEEIADLLMGVLCGVLGASYLDSSLKIHHGSKGGWSGHLKINESFATKTLVLACTISAQVEAGQPRFVRRFIRDKTLDPFSTILWLKAGNMHFTTVRMDVKNCPDTKTQTVDVLLADSNCSETPALDPKYRNSLIEVSKQLFPAAEFGVCKGLRLPPQNAYNDCLFHTAHYQAHVINPLIEDGTVKFRPRPRDWQRDAARLRSYFLFLVYREMKSKGAALADLSAAYAEWNQQQQGQNSKRKSVSSVSSGVQAPGPGREAKRRRADTGAAGEVVSATLRSADMGRCRLAVVHTRYWEAYRDLLKLVEFRSPRHPIPFSPGMILLLSLNALERRKGRTELIMAVVLGIYVLSCSEALARFPVEARACNLEALCKRWRCDNTVQCLVLDKNSLRVASEVRNLAAGNLGLLRQINDRAGTARFCCSVDLGKTAMVRLSTGEMVHCTYIESWPKCTNTERAPDRMKGPGGEGGSSDGAAKRRRSSGSDTAAEGPPSRSQKVDRCLPNSPCVLESTDLRAPPLSKPPGAPETVTMELFEEVVTLVSTIPVSLEVERDLAASFRAMCRQNRGPILTSHRDVDAIRGERSQHRVKAKSDEQFRTQLVLEILQYISNALQSAALAGSLSGKQRKAAAAAAFSASLVKWVQTSFIPVVRERLPDSILSPLLTAAYDWGGQLQMTHASLGAAAAAPGTGGALMLTAARHQGSVPTARRLAFEEFQHLKDRCEKCAAECKSARSRFICSCSAICCKACYGLKAADANSVTGYRCDACREELKGAAVVHPREDLYFCFACRVTLLPLEIKSWCPDCHCRFCQRCATLALSERQHPAAPKRFSDGSSVVGEDAGWTVTQKCPTCDGSEKHEEGRKAVCFRIMDKVLGRKVRNFRDVNWAELKRSQLKVSKDPADELGDLLYDLFFNGCRDAFATFLPPFLELVAAQLRESICPSVDPFHLLYYMSQDINANTYLLARVCRAQAKEALSKSKTLVPQAVLGSSEALPEGRPQVLRVAIYASDGVLNSPTADLAVSVLEHFCNGPDAGRFEFFLFADGPPDLSHPSAEHIVRLFKDSDRLVLFTAKMSAKTKYAKFLETKIHALITLTGWTHGHIAEVIAALGSGPSPVVVFNWLGWAGLMCMPEAVHFTIVGLHALSPRQKLECEAIRERVAVVSCYQPVQGHWSHPKDGRRWTREDFNLPASEGHFIFFFAGSINRIVEDILYMWLDIAHRVVGSCLLLLSRPKGMRTRIKKWIAKYIETAHPDFDASRVLFRPFQSKAYFCGLIQAAVENGAGACLDSVDPIGLHTTAGDVFGNGGTVLTYRSENGFQTRVALELHAELGTHEHCVAESRAAFPDLCVRYALNKRLQRAMRQYLPRVYEERGQSAKLPRQLLQVIDEGYAMFVEAGHDYTKLRDFDVTAELPPVQSFAESPEYAALAAVEVGPDAAQRKKLLAQMRAADLPLEERMEPHALKIMEELQRKGLTLLSVVGAGAFSIAISAIAEQNINPSVPAGTRVALKLSREGVQVGHIKNHSLAREGINTILLETRLARKDFGDIIPAPVFLWDSAKTGRCFWGHTAAAQDGYCLVFECVELIDECFGDVIKPFGEQWMRQGVLGEGFQDKVLRPLFQAMFELRHTAGLAAMDLKPANMGRRANGRCVLWDLGHSVVYSLSDASERQTNALPVALSRNATLAIGTDGQTVKAKGRRLLGRKDNSGLCLVSNQQASEYCLALTQQGKGWGRVAGGTPGYADSKLKGATLEAEVAYAYDMFAGGRSILKLMTHDRSKQRLAAWEESARQAAAAGEAGIQRMILEAVDPSSRTQIAQGIMVGRLASLIAGLLHPDPMERMGAHWAMLHTANTLPFLSPQYSLALEDGTGIVIPGGPVESLPVPYREFPALEGKSLPPIVLLPQPSMGLGAQLRRALKQGEVAAVYGGKLILTTDTAALRNACPTRYAVSVKGVKGFEAFICDAAQTPERPFKWFVDNSVAGPFMNGRDGVGFDVNCDLDRASAWLDDAGCVWFVLRANRDIAEGEWLMWKYNWMAGAGIAIPGLTFTFD